MMTTQAIRQPVRSSFLRNVLLGNALFSTLSGLAFVFATQPISRFLGWSNPWILPIIGIGLLGFAFIVFRTATQELEKTREVIFADLAWVITSVIILVTGWVPLTVGGMWAVGIIADIVGTFALLQYLGLRRIKRS